MTTKLLKTYLLLLFVLASISSFGQNINFTDPVFKQALLNYSPTIDTNNDGEISLQEASIITELEITDFKKEEYYDSISGTYLIRDGISNFQGIENFTNLTSLICEENDLTSLDISALMQLTYLDCSRQTNSDGFPGGLTTLILPNSSSLTHLNISDNYLTSLDVSSYTSLTNLSTTRNLISNLILPTSNSLIELNVHSNQLNTLDVSNLTSLTKISCSSNNLTTLILPNTTTLTRLNCSGNQLTSLDVTPYTALDYLAFSLNSLTTIDLSQNIVLNYLGSGANNLTSLDVSLNTNLESLFCGDNLITDLNLSTLSNLRYFNAESNQLSTLNIKNGSNEEIIIFTIIDNPSLNLVCVDDIAFANDEFDDKDPQTGFTDICSFIPTNSNTISGTVTFDFDANGCDPLDQKLSNTQLRNTSANTFSSTFTDTNGQYILYTQEVNNTLDIIPNLPSFFTVTPNLSQNVTFTGTGATQVIDFCVTANTAVNDVKVSILPTTESRPGFETTVRVFYENAGSTSLSGTVNLTFDDLKQVFLNATEPTANQTSNALTWNYANLLPFEQRYIDVTFLINRPTDPVNPVNNGDVLSYTSTINPTNGDANPTDNTANLDDITIGSYDPNDIIALEGEFIDPNQVSEFLNYRIRFQNTGTASAINVVVENELDTDLDWGSFQPISASHDYRVNITNQNKLEFIFENIHLPDSTTNEPASNGWIFYKIKPKSTLTIGDVIENTADIYFDFNAPVITNTYTTEIKRPTIDPIPNLEGKVFPNPTKRFANIKVNLKSRLTVFNKYGIKVFKHKLKKGKNKLDFGCLQPGRYFLKIRSKDQIIYKKLIIRKKGNRRNR